MLAVILIKPKSSHWKLLIHFCNNHAIQYNSTADLAAIHYILSLNYTWCTCDVMLHGMVYIRKKLKPHTLPGVAKTYSTESQHCVIFNHIFHSLTSMKAEFGSKTTFVCLCDSSNAF